METGQLTRILTMPSLSLACVVLVPAGVRAGGVPDAKICRDAATLAQADVATQGGCMVLDRRKGNCSACHLIAGTASGDIAPPLAYMAARFPDKKRLRARIEDARRFNPETVMPPFGAHRILAPEEINKSSSFLLTL